METNGIIKSAIQKKWVCQLCESVHFGTIGTENISEGIWYVTTLWLIVDKPVLQVAWALFSVR